MFRQHLHPWRRCRVLLALALCAWLGLVGAAWAQHDCCAAMGTDGGLAAMMHGHGHAHPAAPATTMHADCSCAHGAATLPSPVVSAVRVAFPATAGLALAVHAPSPPHTPPLRPPLA